MNYFNLHLDQKSIMKIFIRLIRSIGRSNIITILIFTTIFMIYATFQLSHKGSHRHQSSQIIEPAVEKKSPVVSTILTKDAFVAEGIKYNRFCVIGS